MNFIVIMIMSIIIFGFGIKFISDLARTAVDVHKISLSEIDKMGGGIICGGSDPVCLDQYSIKIRRGDYVPIGIKILNVLEPPSSSSGQDFDVDISPSNPIGYKKDKTPITDPPSPPLVLYPDKRRSLFIEKNEEKIARTLVQVPRKAIPGVYIVNFYVKTNVRQPDGTLDYVDYANVRKLQVEVP